MTEYPYNKSLLPQYYPQQQQQHQTNHTHSHHSHLQQTQLQQRKQPLTTATTNTNNFVLNQLNNGLHQHYQQHYNNQQQQLEEEQENLLELTEETLKNNVQIVLNNINRNYNALKKYLLTDKLNNNNCNNNPVQYHKKFGCNMLSSPESDCNSNMSNMGPLGCSIASSTDFTHDNFDYQWFLDYG